MKTIKVWDPMVRIFHWTVALLFVANMTVLDEDSLAHIYAGYAMFGIVLVRLIWGVIGTKHARFSAFWPKRRRTSGAMWQRIIRWPARTSLVAQPARRADGLQPAGDTDPHQPQRAS